MRCPVCLTENTEGARFCSWCGVGLALTADIRPASQLGHEEPVHEGERRLVTVMFADISGFAALAAEMEPESLRELTTSCFDALAPIIERYGGTVHQVVGDEIMALFGAPTAHEDDPERAVRCALALMGAVTSCTPDHRRVLRLHIGISCGMVYAGPATVAGHREYSVMGDAVNVAARLRQAAAPGEVMIGPEVQRQVDRLVECTSAGSLHVKGRSQPVDAYRLLSLGRASGGPTGSGVVSPLVDRRAELAALRAALVDLAAGVGAVVMVTADAGVGKSRLMAEVRETDEGRRVRWLEGRGPVHGASSSYRPFLQILERDAGCTADEGEPQRREKLLHRACSLFGDEAQEFTPFLTALLNLQPPHDLPTHLADLDSESVGHQVFRTVRQYFARAASESPLALVFEDVHWMDASSTALVEHLLPLVRGSALLVCLCGRPYPDSPVVRLAEGAQLSCPDRLVQLDLGPLCRAESEELLGNLVGRTVLPARLRGSLLDRAEGNPFFLEEEVRALIDLGGLSWEHDRWRVTPAADGLAVPGSLQSMITARIDLLDPQPKQLLRLAAVVGRNFVRPILAELAEAGVDLDRCLTQLQDGQLILVKNAGGEAVYAFKHALVQEATYESIPHPRRRELHAQVARCIESLFAERIDECLSLLAYHYSRAEDWQKAQDYLFRAGDQAGRIAADAEAVAHYRRALAAYGQVFGDRWDRVERAALDRKMGEALYRLGRHEEARRCLDQALEALGSPFPTSTGAFRRALLREVAVQISHRLLPGFVWRHRPRPDARAVEELCRVLTTVHWIDTFAASERLQLASSRSLNTAEAAGLDDYAVDGYLFAGIVCLFSGFPSLAGHYDRLALDVARRTGKPLHVAQAYLAVGYREYARGRGDALLEAAGIAREAALQAGYAIGWSSAMAAAAFIHLEQGRLREALALQQLALVMAQEAGHPLLEGHAEGGIGWSLDWLGELNESESHHRRCADLMAAAGDLLDGLHATSGLAYVHLRQGRLRECLSVLQHVEDVAAGDPHLRTSFNTYVWMYRAEIRLAQLESCLCAGNGDVLEGVDSDWGEAISLDDERHRARAACKDARACIRLYAGAAVPAYRVWGTYAWLCGRRRAARRSWHRSLRAGRRLGYTYQLALTHLEMGRRLGDLAHLETAEHLLAGMDAKYDLGIARELLSNLE